MARRSADSSRRLLTLDRIDRVRVQVGLRASPDDPAHVQFLLDLPVPEAVADDRAPFDEQLVLAALQPVLYSGAGAPRHYSLDRHMWHTSWGASPRALEVGLLVTTGARSTANDSGTSEGVARAFRDLMQFAGQPQPTPTSRDAAVLRARRGAATAFAIDSDVLSLSTEEHHAAENTWTIGLRSTAGEEYEVDVGYVDGYAGSVRVRHRQRIEVPDSIGSE